MLARFKKQNGGRNCNDWNEPARGADAVACGGSDARICRRLSITAGDDPHAVRPGSATDTAARLIGKYLQDSLGQPFIVENRDGAGGMIAAEAVARAAPDGYTILLTSNSTHSAAPALFKTVPHDPIKDFTPIARVGSLPSFIAVTPDLPVKTIQEFVAYAKANPGKINAGYGNDRPHHD
ncbi:MAG: tripartite tricarboxylate transporter substrate-binding protein [Xanthobacteraceae bacterium]